MSESGLESLNNMFDAGFYSYPNYLGQDLRKDGIVNWNSNYDYAMEVNHAGADEIGILERDRKFADRRTENLLDAGTTDPFIMFEFVKIDHNSDGSDTTSQKLAKKIVGLVGEKTGTMSIREDTGNPNEMISSTKTTEEKEKQSALDKAKDSAGMMKMLTTAYKSWKPKKIPGDTIVLYMTPGISIADSISYDEDTRKLAAVIEELDSVNLKDHMTGQGANDMTTLAISAAAGIGAAAGNLLSKVLPGGTITGMVTTLLGGSVADAIKGEAEMRRGSTMNPNEYIRYKSTPLRNFNFDFKFLPDTPEESIHCKNIIKSFRKNAHATKQSSITIEIPSTCIVSFHGIKDIVQLPPLVVTSVNTTFSPTAVTRFTDKRPVEMNFSVSLQEIQPIYSGDVEAGY
jgi:hypothetical protein